MTDAANLHDETQTTLLGDLGRFTFEVSKGDFPDDVLMEAKYCLLDTIGCIIAGSFLPEVVEFARAEAGISSVASEVIGAHALGFDLYLNEAGAARLNGYSGDILELNDLIGGHASIGAVSAALSLAETLNLSGDTLLRALIAGIETTARVNMGYRESNEGRDNRPFTQVGISSEGIPSTIGVSALTSVALGLGRERIISALGIGGTLAGWCPVEVLFGTGGTIKPIMFGGWPATVGMLAARYAAAGITGPTHLIESPVGLYATLANGHDPDIVRGSQGWQLQRPRRKWHACCGFIHAGVDGVALLRQAYGRSIFEGVTVEIGVVPPVAAVISSLRPPETETEARFSGRYNVAVAAVGADRILPAHAANAADYLAHPDVRDLMPRVRYVGNDALPHFSHSHIRLLEADGSVRAEQHVAGYKGSAAQLLTHAEVEKKFLDLASGGLRDPHDYMIKILTLETMTDLSFLYSDVISRPLH